MQTKIIAGVARLVLATVLMAGVVGQARAQDDTALSADDERAYQAALASWRHFAEINEEVGLPPLGDEPQREAFVGFAKGQQDAAVAQAAAKQEANARWQQRLEEVQPYHCTLVRPGRSATADRRIKSALSDKQKAIQVADEKWEERDQVERALNDIAMRYGAERRTTIGDQPAVLAGEIDGGLIWVVPQNMIAAASISADELWPTNSTPWPASSTGLGLTGTNVLLSMWEVGGAARESHVEFQSRVIQIDQSATNAIPLDYHATGVAGTIAGGGVVDLVSPVATGKLMRGVAYQADVDSYDIDFFSSELASAAAGTTNVPGVRVSNHSWGILSGWHQETLIFGTNVYPNAWVWDGHPNFVEDWKFGFYYPDLPDGYGSTQLDSFMANSSTRHLLLYAAGNDRYEGPGSAPSEYWWTPDRVNWYIFQNSSAGERDWSCGDGDTYAFDTIAPPGTAKNVLTVGSVLDVYHVVGSQTNWGYATNSTVTLSRFSGCGPTDDGRIKPDVVAVGQADTNARPFGIVTPSETSDTGFNNLAGTSFACPEVTGGLGLSMQRRVQLFPDLDPETDALRGSTLKGLAIHTADDIGNPGPDYQTGWGLFNAVSVVQHIETDAQEGRGTHIKELELDVGETNSWLVALDGSKAFKVTVPWTDPPGTAPSASEDPMSRMLVNDIDLWVETEDGSQTFFPWVLNPDITNETEAARSANATNGVDSINNVEQVVLASPTAGTYRICIAHRGGLPGGSTPTNQWVSVLSSGDTPLPVNLIEFEQSPSTNQFLISFECDPGAHLILESSTNLLDGASWQEEGTLTTVAWTNAVLADESSDVRFWRLRRETGE